MIPRISSWMVALALWVVSVGNVLAENTTQYEDAVQLMYIAYYGRPGDPAGIRYWADVLDENGGKLESMIDAFGNSEEYRKRFSGRDNAALVNNIYQQLFNRDAEDAGLNWYLGELEAGRMSLASIALNVAAGANPETEDGQTVINRMKFANDFTEAMKVLNLSYTEAQIDVAQQVLQLVTHDPDTLSVAADQFQAIRAQFAPLPNVKVQVSTNYGDIVFELLHQEAPYTTDNFLRYVDEGFYNNTLIHRVVPDFVIQGGGFDEAGYLKETHDPIKNEASNGLSNVRGTVAMARLSDPDSANSQFFINLVDNTFLDYSETSAGYAVFARVTAGMDVVDTIAGVETTTMSGFNDVPVQKVVVHSITRLVE